MDYPKVVIEKLSNGFLVSKYETYGDTSEKKSCLTFCDAVEDVATRLKEEEFASTLKNSQAIATAFGALCVTALAPKLLALEAKVSPGIENLVKDDSISF